MDNHFLEDAELASIKEQMETLKQRIINHFHTPKAKRLRMIKNGFMNEDGSPSMRFAEPGRWKSLDDYWNRPI